jgi:hypothetical protein
MPQTVVCVEWVDACYERGSLKAGELGGLLTLKTVGWLVREEEDHVSVAAEWCPREETYRDISHIPRVGIVSVKRVKLS